MRKIIFFILPTLFLLLLFFLITPTTKVYAQGTCSCVYSCNEWDVCSCGIDSSGCEVGYTCPLELSDCEPTPGQCNTGRIEECVYQGAGECTCQSAIGGCRVTSGCTSEGYTAVCGQDCSCTCQLCGEAVGQPCCVDREPSCNEGKNLYCNGGVCASRSQLQPIFCKDGQQSNDPSSGEIYTAIGCIPVTGTQEFTEFLLRWGMGVAGGIAILLIIYAGYLIMTSAGNPQRLQAGKELLTAAIMGLVLLLFGVFILQLIGVKILRIPDFGQ